MNGSFKVIPTVFVAALRDDKVVLVKRKNTSFMDGFYDLPSGHIEEGEDIKDAAVRELLEETGLRASPEKLELFNVTQCFLTPGKPYLYFMFKTREFSGEPKIMEAELSDDVAFFDLAGLPKVTPYSKNALDKIGSKEISFDILDAYDRPKV